RRPDDHDRQHQEAGGRVKEVVVVADNERGRDGERDDPVEGHYPPQLPGHDRDSTAKRTLTAMPVKTAGALASPQGAPAPVAVTRAVPGAKRACACRGTRASLRGRPGAGWWPPSPRSRRRTPLAGRGRPVRRTPACRCPCFP